MTNPVPTEGREGQRTAGPTAPQSETSALVRCVWECKVGARMLDIDLPDGADAPMRRAVQQAFVDITGTNPEFCFSGWGGKLDEFEISVVEERPPSAVHEADWHLRNAAPDLLAALIELFGTSKNEMVSRGLPIEWQDDCAMARAERAIAKAEGR